MNPLFNPQEIESLLRENAVSWVKRPEYFESIASSNDYLLGLSESLHGRLCICDYQTRGKGRLGKQWFSSAGANLMFSLGWVPKAGLSSEVSLVVGVALADALKQLGVADVALKWPNDVQSAGRKLAGVLLESRVSNGRMELVIGVGLNVRHQLDDMDAVEQPWIDLMQLGLGDINRQQLLIRILTILAQRLAQLEALGFASIREDWLAYHAYQGEIMSYQYQGQDRIGKLLGLDDRGALMFESEGKRVTVSSGEVSCVRAIS